MNRETIYAGIFGAVVADALGVPYEFHTQNEMKQNPATTMTGEGTYNQPVGTWSDDSSMTLATLESLTNGIDYEDMMQKFCQWYTDAEYTPHEEVFDIGITTSKALEDYINNKKDAVKSGLTDLHSNGNGSLMRILPVSLYLNAKGYKTKEQRKIIDNVSSLTHAHEISKASCNIYNTIIQEVLNNPDETIQEHVTRGLEKTKKYYENMNPSCFKKIYNDPGQWKEENLSNKGYVEYSLEVALYYAYYTKSYRESVLKAVNLGGDTDTNAMITGGLTALYYGYEDIPQDWINKTAKQEYIKDLCDKFHESIQ